MLTRYIWDLSFQPSVMMVTPVLGQQTLNSSKHDPASSFAVGPLTSGPASAIVVTIGGSKSELAELNGSTLAYQNMLIIFFTFSINTPAAGNFILF
ncbi:hypothetical protein AMTRI_Chr10g227600 [Amborella trichopoda]